MHACMRCGQQWPLAKNPSLKNSRRKQNNLRSPSCLYSIAFPQKINIDPIRRYCTVYSLHIHRITPHRIMIRIISTHHTKRASIHPSQPIDPQRSQRKTTLDKPHQTKAPCTLRANQPITTPTAYQAQRPLESLKPSQRPDLNPDHQHQLGAGKLYACISGPVHGVGIGWVMSGCQGLRS